MLDKIDELLEEGENVVAPDALVGKYVGESAPTCSTT